MLYQLARLEQFRNIQTGVPLAVVETLHKEVNSATKKWINESV